MEVVSLHFTITIEIIIIDLFVDKISFVCNYFHFAICDFIPRKVSIDELCIQ